MLREFEQTLPVGLGVQKIYDTTNFINQSTKGVTHFLRDVVILVVLFFPTSTSTARSRLTALPRRATAPVRRSGR